MSEQGQRQTQVLDQWEPQALGRVTYGDVPQGEHPDDDPGL
jgi:hypothetical protein